MPEAQRGQKTCLRTHSYSVSALGFDSTGQTPSSCTPSRDSQRLRVQAAGTSPGGGGRWPGASPSRPERPLLLAYSLRGQALQGRQKSVVNTVPNPKWLLLRCNPIKLRLVYLSSLGLFITVQMAATFGRLCSLLPAARHAQLSSTGSGLAPARGLGTAAPRLEGGPQGMLGVASTPHTTPCSAHQLPPALVLLGR